MNSITALVFFGLLAIVAAAPFTEDQIKLGNIYAQECIKETKIDPAVARQLKDGDFSTKDEKAPCFTFCVLKKANFVDSDGNQNIDVITKKLLVNTSQEKVDAAIEQCKDVSTGTTPCDKAYTSFQCYRGLF